MRRVFIAGFRKLGDILEDESTEMPCNCSNAGTRSLFRWFLQALFCLFILTSSFKNLQTCGTTKNALPHYLSIGLVWRTVPEIVNTLFYCVKNQKAIHISFCLLYYPIFKFNKQQNEKHFAIYSRIVLQISSIFSCL